MKYYLVVLILISSFCNGQAVANISANFTFKPSPFEISEYGDSFLNVYYGVSFYENSFNENGRKDAVCLLQIGKNAAKFFDYNQLKIDSLDVKYQNYPILKAKETNEYLKIKIIWKNVLLKNKDSSIVQDNFRKTYQYTESSPKLNWRLETGEKNILGYSCKKASTVYRGRKYHAWYTTDIPFDKGPSIFAGLPGLIMEVADNEDKYHFTVIGIDKNPMEIYLRNEKTIIKTTREKFRNVQRTYYENPNAFYSGKAFNADGTPMFVNSKPILYAPMELE